MTKMKPMRIVCCFIALLLCLVTVCGCTDTTSGKTDSTPAPSDAGTVDPSTGVSDPTSGDVQQPVVTPTPNTQETQNTQKPTTNPTSLQAARAKTQVGAWYSLWYDSLEENSFWDNEGTGQTIYYKPLLSNGTFGRYDSASKSEMEFHIQEITKAGIDFLIFDQTNMIDAKNATGQAWINVNSIKMAKSIWEWNKVEGNRKLRYCSAIGAYATINDDYSIIESEAKKIYERYIKQRWGTENDHVYVDGKPLLVLFTITEAQWNAYKKTHSTPYTDKFTLRYSVGHAYDPGLWGWVVPNLQVTEDVATILPGWYKFDHPLEKVYRKRGETYQKNWEKILASNTIPNFIVINSINEYAEHTGVFPAKTSDFPSNYPIEKWLNASGQEDPYLYWNMTIKYIQKYRNGDRK